MDKFAEPRTFEPLPYRELDIRRFHRSGVFTPSLRDFAVDAIEPIRGHRGVDGSRRLTEYPPRGNPTPIPPDRSFVPVVIDPDQLTCLPTRQRVRRAFGHDRRQLPFPEGGAGICQGFPIIDRLGGAVGIRQWPRAERRE